MRRLMLLLPLALLALSPMTRAADEPRPVKLLIITGDHGHDWKATTQVMQDFLSAQGRVEITVCPNPRDYLTSENLAKFDAIMLNYRDTAKGAEETKWTDANKEAFLNAVKGGKGLVVVHHASSAFVKPNWVEFEKMVGGWRTQGFHGPAHQFTVKTTSEKHPISEGLVSSFDHPTDELYQNSMLPAGAIVLGTAYSDPKKEKGTGKDEPVIWVNMYGQGRVYNNVLGHDATAMADPAFQAWMRRGVEWAATGKVKSDPK